MTVRWKPLLILSGLFVVIALVGVIAMAYTLVPRGSADILPLARAERGAKHYDNAKVHYLRALQQDGKNAAIHEELASMFAEWAEQAPAEKRAELSASRRGALAEAAKYGKTRIEPRRQLLEDAMRHDEAALGVYWAKEVLRIEPTNADAHYVMAAEALEERTPNLPEIKRDLAALEAAKAPEIRIAWIRARIAQLTDDGTTLQETLSRARTLSLADGVPPADRMAMLRLRALDVQTTTDVARLPERVEALNKEANRLLAGRSGAPARIVRVSLLLEQIQRSLTNLGAGADPKIKADLDSLVEAIDRESEAIFQKALSAPGQPDLQISLSYADHLRFRGKRDECLKVINEALKGAPGASSARKNVGIVVMNLHAVAVETALANLKDLDRIAKATPHIKELIASSYPRYQGLGHLFQGAIDLERAGVNGAKDGGDGREVTTVDHAKLRASALNHLKIAATQLPDLAEAQARYGVALVLAMEQGLGRQYLQKAVRQGNLDPQYQIWAAWSMLQAGYPEEAEPIVTHLFDQVAKGRQPKSLEGTLHLLRAEIHQARRSPDELKKALAEYERSTASGQPATPAVQLRVAQIDVQLGHPEQALKRIEALRAQGQGGPGAEQLAVLTLQEMGKPDQARKILDEARRRYPRSEELVALDATMLAKANRPQEADRILADFLAQDRTNVAIALMRAQVLADLLGDAKEARKILVDLAERSDNSAPLVQLALLDLKQKDYDAVASTIAKIRGRWKESAAGDLLEAQMALDQGDLAAASRAFDDALQKDPNNKMVLFWKAQLDSRNGAAPAAAKVLEEIVKDRPTKELDSGLSLTTAAESALANMALDSGDLDAAIERFEGLRSGEAGTLRRGDRWQLATAYAVKGEWANAKQEIDGLLNNPKSPPTNDERVRAAKLYRRHGEEAAAQAQLDAVLKVNPAHPGAVVTRASLLADAKKFDEAAALLRKTIKADREKPPAVFFLLLADVENRRPPADAAAGRALATVDQGLEVHPDALELIKAKYFLLRLTRDDKAALAFVESKAENGAPDQFRQLLVEVYSEQKDYDGAERVLRALQKKHPKDPMIAANLVRLASLQAIEAAGRNDEPRQRSSDDKAAALIREFRAQFPGNLTFLQMECDLAARRGDLNRAAAITQEMDKVAKNSTAGPLARARLFMAQGRTREAADAYVEALRRNPQQPEVRILLGQASLKLGEPDEALRQAGLVLDVHKDQPEALLLQAQAMADQAGPESQVTARRAQAVSILAAAIRKQPRFIDAYHLTAAIELMSRRRDKAIAALKAGLKAVPDDAAGLAQLIELLSGPRDDGSRPAPAEVAEAQALAKAVGDRDDKGNLSLAIAVGFHKAGQFDLAMPWAAKAASKLDAPPVHLNYGDLLLSRAEATKDPETAKAYFQRAVEQYDLVLKAQATSVEAINNKAWILHAHLGDSRGALELALGLLKRTDPAALPGEFFDTLGAVQEATGRIRDAEDSYSQGLRKAPEHPVLNFHMGKLLLAEGNRNSKAISYLEKAYASRDRLSPEMADEVASLMKKATRN